MCTYSFVVVIVIINQTSFYATELTSGAYYGGDVPVYVLYLLLTHFTGEVTKERRGDAPFLESPSKSWGIPLFLGFQDKSVLLYSSALRTCLFGDKTVQH